MRRTGRTSSWSSSVVVATGYQYRRSKVPIGVPGPTWVRRWFASFVSIYSSSSYSPVRAGGWGRGARYWSATPQVSFSDSALRSRDSSVGNLVRQGHLAPLRRGLLDGQTHLEG